MNETDRPSTRRYVHTDDFYIERKERKLIPTLTCRNCCRVLSDTLQSKCYRCGWDRMKEAGR